MPTFLVFATSDTCPLLVDHVTAPDVQSASSMVRVALAREQAGIGGGGRADVTVALVEAAAVLTYSPPGAASDQPPPTRTAVTP